MREHNEDAFLVDSTASWECDGSAHFDFGRDDPLLLMVCDGMGGAAAGDVASRLAVETVRSALGGRLQLPRPPARRLESALHRANAAVYARSVGTPEQRGMGSTTTAVLVWRDQAHVAQVGDSRAYLLRSGALWQITDDQSLVKMLVETNQITEEAARTHPGQNMLLQALGTQETMTPAITSLQLQRGDRLLVCSDGLTGPVDDQCLRDVLDRWSGVPEAADELIRLALANGARDNVTAVVADVRTANLPAPTVDPVVLDRVKVYRYGAADEPAPSWKSWLRSVLPATDGGRQGDPCLA